MRTLLLLPLLGAALASSDYKTYHGYKVLRTQVLDKASSDLLHSVMIEVCLLCFISQLGKTTTLERKQSKLNA